MVQVNLALKEINCKIVYFGPGLSGKTTNLEVVHQKAPRDAKGELTSIATESDRTLFFDFMPLDLGTVSGMKTKFQLYTVPGQVYYNSTRKLVLRGADGVVFVADSRAEKMQENLESLDNLEECLAEQGKKLAEFPHVIQFNKRDLPGAMPVAELSEKLNRYGAPVFEAVASAGDGVIETFKALSGLVLDKVKAMAEQRGTARPGPRPPASAPAPAAPAPGASAVKPGSSPGGGGASRPPSSPGGAAARPASSPGASVSAASGSIRPPRGLERNGPPMPEAKPAATAVADAPPAAGAPRPAPSREAAPRLDHSGGRKAAVVPNIVPGSDPTPSARVGMSGSGSHRLTVSSVSRGRSRGVHPLVWVAIGLAAVGGAVFALTQGLL